MRAAGLASGVITATVIPPNGFSTICSTTLSQTTRYGTLSCMQKKLWKQWQWQKEKTNWRKRRRGETYTILYFFFCISVSVIFFIHSVFYPALLSRQDIDYVVCTGDLVPHHIWRISREENVAIMKEMSELLRSVFPTTPIYGSIGNHESFPRDRWDDILYRKLLLNTSSRTIISPMFYSCIVVEIFRGVIIAHWNFLILTYLWWLTKINYYCCKSL